MWTRSMTVNKIYKDRKKNYICKSISELVREVDCKHVLSWSVIRTHECTRVPHYVEQNENASFLCCENRQGFI